MAVAVEPQVEKVESSTPTPEPPQQQQMDGELHVHVCTHLASIRVYISVLSKYS